MKTIKKVPITHEFVKFMPDYENFEEGKIYISKEFKVAIHRCLCGCGEKTVMPIDAIINGKDHGWKLIEENNGTISFTPSVGNYQIPCKSHYIITKSVANFV